MVHAIIEHKRPQLHILTSKALSTNRTTGTDLTMFAHCVPFPLPGPPRMKTTCGFAGVAKSAFMKYAPTVAAEATIKDETIVEVEDMFAERAQALTRHKLASNKVTAAYFICPSEEKYRKRYKNRLEEV
jgi:hypothetical protein